MKKKLLFIILFLLVLVLGFKPKEPIKNTLANPPHAFKKFPVLEYHLVDFEERRWTRSIPNFKKDLEWLHKNNFYPMNLKDILTNFQGLPPGKTPVVFTFDDSSSSQFRYLKDGTIDPNCAVGLMKAFHDQHPDTWPMRATFFIVIGTNNPDRNIFGQKEYQRKKLQQLTAWGMEVASHTYSHERLSDISEDLSRYSLARSVKILSELSSQEIVSLATPMGLYPKNEAIFSMGYQKIKYNLKLVCEVSGGWQVVPWDPSFRPYHINRIQTISSEWKKFFSRKD